MSDYDINLMREKLKSATNQDTARIDLIQRFFFARREIPTRDRLTTDDMAAALSRDDAERTELAAAFRSVDRDQDIWLQCAEIWLTKIGVLEPYWDADLSVLEDMLPTRKHPK